MLMASATNGIANKRIASQGVVKSFYAVGTTKMQSFDQDGVRFNFSVHRLCFVQGYWQRREGTEGVQPFGAMTNDYHHIEVRHCEKCPGWRRRSREQYSGKPVEVYICRCRECNHSPFVVDEWRASEPGTKFITRVLSDDSRARRDKRLARAREAWDNLTEAIQISIDFMDQGEGEQAKLTLADQLNILRKAGLLQEADSNDDSA